MPKFFVGKEAIVPPLITITGPDALHMSKSLRMQPGDKVTVGDGCGTDYLTVIKSITKEQVTLTITDIQPSIAEPPVKVTLYQALPKQGKMEQIIQKNTELGVSRIVPVYTRYCVVKPTGNKQERWQKIADEAAKQCGRGILPTVCETVDFAAVLKLVPSHQLFILPYENARGTRLADVVPATCHDAAIFIGPEGGFAETEVNALDAAGARIVTLGNRILRTETAGSAATAILMSICGDM